MRRSIHDSAKTAESTEVLTRHGEEATLVSRLRGTAVALGISLAVLLGGLLAATPAMAVTSMSSSQKVALIPGPAGPPGATIPYGVMPTSQYVSGRPDESFDKFSFTNVALSQITPSELSQFDTVALIQVPASSLSSAQKSALAGFVAGGGKLLIHDSDETSGNDYSWILPGSSYTQEGAGCTDCGSQSGSAQILSNSDLISSNPADSSYVNLAQLQEFTDGIGDANLLVSTDPRWFAVVEGTNAQGESGAAEAYANNNGLVIFNGFDTDEINQTPAPPAPWRCTGQYGDANYQCSPTGSHPSVDWLAQMWYSELNEGWGSASSNNGLPQTTPVSAIGTAVSPGQAGLPGTVACTTNRKVLVRLKRLVHHHPKVVEIEVYVNGRRKLRERGHWRNVTLAHLPKNRSFTVKIVAVTKRHYLLISKKKYRAC
jgi:hypothetical protein